MMLWIDNEYHGGTCIAISAPGMHSANLRCDRHIVLSHVILCLTFGGRRE